MYSDSLFLVFLIHVYTVAQLSTAAPANTRETIANLPDKQSSAGDESRTALFQDRLKDNFLFYSSKQARKNSRTAQNCAVDLLLILKRKESS